MDTLRLFGKGTDQREHRDDQNLLQGSCLFGKFAQQSVTSVFDRTLFLSTLSKVGARQAPKRHIQGTAGEPVGTGECRVQAARTRLEMGIAFATQRRG
jgi:hypothetical protein